MCGCVDIMSLKDSFNQLDEKDTGGIVVEIDDALRAKLQATLLDMYKDILTVCRKYGIVPYLGGGSALGAIRHKGFIPWDDDMDINMTREDYEKFQAVFETELSDRYILNAPNYSEDVITRFPKILKKGTRYAEIGAADKEELQCLALDVFIIENVPENKLYRKIKGLYCNVLELIAGRVSMYQRRSEASTKMLKATGVKEYVLNSAVGFLFSFRKASRWNDAVDRAVQYHKSSKLCGFPTGRKHYFGEIHEKGQLFPEVYVDFESIKAPVFKEYHYYLTRLYGDYMQIPPENKREKHFVEKIEL